MNNYIENNRWYITASKLKDFMKSPEAYYIKYIKEAEIDREDTRSFRIGTAFDFLMCYGMDEYSKKYYIDRGETVLELVKKLSDSGINITGKEKKDELVGMIYGDISEKTRLTEAEGDTVMSLYLEALRQPLWDNNWNYEVQKTVTAAYKGTLKLKGTLDRFSLEQSKIRDFKTTADLSRFQYDFADKFGYNISMAFYFALVKIAYDVECDVILDVVQTAKPYPSEVFEYSKNKLTMLFNGFILPELDKLHALHTVWEATGDESVWTRKPTDRRDLYSLDAYSQMSTAVQETITFM